MRTLLQQTGGQIAADLNSRFGHDNFEIMRLAEACIPSKNYFMNTEFLEYAAV